MYKRSLQAHLIEDDACRLFFSLYYRELELALTLFYQEELGEESALLHHGIEVGIGRGAVASISMMLL